MKFAKTRQRQCKFSQKSPRIVPRAVASSCVIIKRTLWPLIPWQSGRPRSESCGWSCGLACVFRESPASLLRRFRESPLWSPLRFFLPRLVPAHCGANFFELASKFVSLLFINFNRYFYETFCNNTLHLNSSLFEFLGILVRTTERISRQK